MQTFLPAPFRSVLILILFFVLGMARAQEAEKSATATATSTSTATATATPAASATPSAPAAPRSASARSAPTVTPTPHPLETRIAEIDARIKSVQESFAPEQAAEMDISVEQLKMREQRLADLKEIIQRQISASRRRDDRRNSLEELQREVEQSKARPTDPKAFMRLADLDALGEQIADGVKEQQTLVLAVENTQKVAADAAEAARIADQERRAAREQIEANKDPGAAPRLQFEAEIAELGLQIAEANAEFAKIQAEAAVYERDRTQLHLDHLRSIIRKNEDKVIFNKSELQEHLTDIQKRRDKLEARLRDERKNNSQNEALRDKARDDFEAARDEAEIAARKAMLDRRDSWAMTSGRAVELLEEQLAGLKREEDLWQKRFEVARGGANDLQMAEWEKDIQALRDDNKRNEAILQSRMNDTRAVSLELERKLAAWDPAWGDKTNADARLRALRRREENTVEHLGTLTAQNRLAWRVANEIKKARQHPTWRDQWLHVRARLAKVWNYELFVINDRAFTLGRISQSAIIFVTVLGLTLLLLRLLKKSVLKRRREMRETTGSLLADVPIIMVRSTHRTFVLMIAIYFALLPLPLSGVLKDRLTALPIIGALLQIGFWTNAVLIYWVEDAQRRRRATDRSSVSTLGAMGFFLRMAMWSVVILFALDNLGINVTAIVAGFGIGGIAVAFALQKILGDIFCSVAILLDKPFSVGDYIVVGDQRGTVEMIGIKTTRLRSVWGEQIIFSNADLIGSRISNFEQMPHRRVVFNFSVPYETEADKLEEIPKMVRGIVDSVHNTRFERAHFQKYGVAALEFEVVYYVTDPNYILYMDVHQKINLALWRKFREKGIEFAYTGKTAAPPPPVKTAPGPVDTLVAAAEGAGSDHGKS